MRGISARRFAGLYSGVAERYFGVLLRGVITGHYISGHYCEAL
jgi:hypothetical protein